MSNERISFDFVIMRFTAHIGSAKLRSLLLHSQAVASSYFHEFTQGLHHDRHDLVVFPFHRRPSAARMGGIWLPKSETVLYRSMAFVQQRRLLEVLLHGVDICAPTDHRRFLFLHSARRTQTGAWWKIEFGKHHFAERIHTGASTTARECDARRTFAYESLEDVSVARRHEHCVLDTVLRVYFDRDLSEAKRLRGLRGADRFGDIDVFVRALVPDNLRVSRENCAKGSERAASAYAAVAQ